MIIKIGAVNRDANLAVRDSGRLVLTFSESV